MNVLRMILAVLIFAFAFIGLGQTLRALGNMYLVSFVWGLFLVGLCVALGMAVWP